MPKERRDLIGTIIAKKANQLNKEIIVQLNNKERREEEEFNTLQDEFNTNSQRYTKNTWGELQERLKREYTRDTKRYILQLYIKLLKASNLILDPYSHVTSQNRLAVKMPQGPRLTKSLKGYPGYLDYYQYLVLFFRVRV